VSRSEVPQSPLDPITRDSIANGTADHKSNPRPVIQVPII
jgi:hypothetical protein